MDEPELKNRNDRIGCGLFLITLLVLFLLPDQTSPRLWLWSMRGGTLFFMVVFTIAPLAFLLTSRSPAAFTIALPFAGAVIYGIVAAMFPAYLAEHVVPKDWEWPVSPRAEALKLDSGRWVVGLPGKPRVQVYDPQGRYLGGWYVPDSVSKFHLFLDRPATAAAGRLEPALETVLVLRPRTYYSLSYFIRYDLTGQEIGREPAPESVPLTYPTVGQEGLNFPYPWYKWPLAWAPNGFGLMAVGMAGLFVLSLLGLIIVMTNEKRGTVLPAKRRICAYADAAFF